MKIALVQTSPTFGDIAGNAAALAAVVKSLSADFYVLPELCLSGYDFEDPDEAARYAVAHDSDVMESLARAATDRGAGIVIGFAEAPDEGAYGSAAEAASPGSGMRPFNSALLALPDGRRRVYRKTHLFARETLLFRPGDTGFFVEEFRGLRIGVAICFDWIFPESFRTLALRGADLIAHCSNLVLPFCQRVDYARAIENRVYVATANRVGTEERGGRSLTFTGESVLVAPDGDYLLRLPVDRAAAAEATVHPAKARDKRLGEYNDLFADRRLGMYE